MARPSGKPAYDLNPNRCATCGGPIPYEHRRNKYCSHECEQKDRANLTTLGRPYKGGPDVHAYNTRNYAKRGDVYRATRKAKRAENPGSRNQYFAERRARLKAEKAAEGFNALQSKETNNE